MRSSGGGGGGGDDRILSRHLANEQHSTFRGISNNNNNGANQNNGGNGQNDIAEHHRLAQAQQQHFSAAGIGGGGGTFDGLHPSAGGNGGRPNTMSNLPLTLRRSMPAMNGGNGGPNGGGSSAGAASQSRHLSFCAHPVGEEGGGEEEQQRREDLCGTGGNYEGKIAGGRPSETRNVDKIRCTSAHSYTSLSPSGSLVFHPSAAIQPTNFANPIANSTSSSSVGPSAPVGGGGFSSVVDTRQIQVFLKKREDSRATISTTMSEWSSTSTTTTMNPSEASVTHKMATNPAASVPPAGPSMPPTSSSVAGTSMAFKNSRKIFRSSDTRSSIFSVSSSLDSNKEERIIANFEHTPVTASSNRVVVLPRPQQPILAPASHALQVDYAAAGPIEGGGAMMDGLAVNGATERARSSSAELMSHRQSTSACSTSQHHMSNATTVSAAAAAGRRTSIDESKFGANAPCFSSSSPPPLPLLSSSSWHSISDLNSARHSDSPTRSADGMGGHRTMGGGGGGFAEGQHGEKTEIWNSPPPARPQSQASNRRSNYLGELVWQVDETVYCGGIEAAQNQNLLCRLNIEYIVDLSGQEDDPTLANSRPRTEYPCLCPKRTAHSRMTMSIRVKDDSQQMLSRDARPSTVDTKAQMMEREEIIHYFEALIDLIRKARISQKKVLIHSLKGRNRAPAFVAAYLMHCNRQTRVQAINKISKMMSSMRPGTCISDTLQRALMRWQSILGIRAESSRLDTQQLNKMFAVKRTAWN